MLEHPEPAASGMENGLGVEAAGYSSNAISWLSKDYWEIPLLQSQLSHSHSGIVCPLCVASETRTEDAAYLLAVTHATHNSHTGGGNLVQIMYD